MGDYLPLNLIKALSDASIELEIVVDIELDEGTVSLSQTKHHGIPVLQAASSLLHKLQPAYGKSNIATLSIDLIDRSEWGPLIADHYIKNRRALVKLIRRGSDESPFLNRIDVRFDTDDDVMLGTEVAVWREGQADTGEYYNYFTGLVVDYNINDEVLTIEIRDDLYIGKSKVPEENETNTQSLAFQNMNPIDIKEALVGTYGGVPTERIDSDAFDTEKNRWFLGWVFDRVLIRPTSIKQLIDELDDQTFGYVFSDGDKITTTSFVPPAPGQTLKALTDDVLKRSPAVSGKMDDNFFNRCVVYYDYDESGNDKEENYDSVAIYSDIVSQGSTKWAEMATKTVMSKWIRSFTIEQPANITGVVIYHCNPQNGAGTGTLAWNAAAQTLIWTAPGDSAGAAVLCDKDGKYQLFSGAATKYIRVIVTAASLPVGNQSDSPDITTLTGPSIANSLASRWVARFTDPQAEIEIDLDLSDAVHNDKLLRVSDIVTMTSDSIVTKGKNGWSEERIFLTSVRPDILKKTVKINSILTGFKRRYGYIGPVGMTDDYDDSSAADKEYAFIGNDDNLVGVAGEDGYYIW